MLKIYGKQHCTKCIVLKGMLDKKSVKYEYIDIETNIDAKNKLAELNAAGLPVVETETEIYTDYANIIKIVSNLIKEI